MNVRFNIHMIHDGLIPEEVNVWSPLVLRNIFPIVIKVQSLSQDLDTASGHPAFHRVGLKYLEYLFIHFVKLEFLDNKLLLLNFGWNPP